MPKYFKNKNTRYVKTYDLTGKDLIYAETENMYIDYENGGRWLESFPGYRKLTSLQGKIKKIFDMGLGDKGFIVHSGTMIYLCSLNDPSRDILHAKILCDVGESEVCCCRIGENICILYDKHIMVIDNSLKVQNNIIIPNAISNTIYIPTTYVNGEETEQLNLLTNNFKEESLSINADDFAYESEGLKYSIISEAARTCAVIGTEDVFDKIVEIPNRKRINGKYYKVVEISDGAFLENSDIIKVILGRGIKRVGNSAFKDCKNLLIAVMPDGIETIGDSAFSGCSYLYEIYIGATCKSIQYNAFENCHESAKVFLSDIYESFDKCDGIGNLMMYPVYYSEKFQEANYGIPVYTPASTITKVTIDGEDMTYIFDANRGMIKLNGSEAGIIEGKNICITGAISNSVASTSERGVPFYTLLEEGACAIDEVLSCSSATSYDGRAFLFSSKSFPNIVFMSSFTREGVAHPLYFGSLDYFTVGSPLYPITDIKKEGSRLAIAKAGEGGGNIYLCQPKGEERAMFGRKYPIVYTLTNTGINSQLYEFGNSTIFIGNGYVYRMKYSSSSAIFEPISKRCPSSMKTDIKSNVAFASFGGYLVVISGSNMYLGDKRLTFEVPDVDMQQYKWFPISNIGSYQGQYREYFFANNAPEGMYIHPNAGKLASGTVYSYVDESGDTIYYVTIGIRKYRVMPGEEMVGGELIPISAAANWGNNLIFGTECGDIFSFNNDKLGLGPKHIYTSDNANRLLLRKIFKDKLHPYFYTYDGHRVQYKVTTAPYDGELPYVMKSNIRGSLVAKLDKRSNATIYFSTRKEEKDALELGGIPLGECYFRELNFNELSFSSTECEIVSIPEKQDKWTEKTITVYTNEHKGAFAISSISLGFKVDGCIAND